MYTSKIKNINKVNRHFFLKKKDEIERKKAIKNSFFSIIDITFAIEDVELKPKVNFFNQRSQLQRWFYVIIMNYSIDGNGNGAQRVDKNIGKLLGFGK